MPKISQLPPEENPTPDDEFVMVDKALGITKKVTGDNISGAFGDESIGIEKIENLSTSLNVDGTLKNGVVGPGQLGDSGWINITPTNGATGDAQVRKIGAVCYLRGGLNSSSTASGLFYAGQAPVGFRPVGSTRTLPLRSGGTANIAYIAVDTNGNILVNKTSTGAFEVILGGSYLTI